METRNMYEAFWAQARADYIAAVTLMDAGIYFGSVFFSQQAAEQALKAANIKKFGEIIRSHNLTKLAKKLSPTEKVIKSAVALTPEFMSTRNPEVTGRFPAQAYDLKKARLQLIAAQTIIDWVKIYIV